jgi:hypothetical protein
LGILSLVLGLGALGVPLSGHQVERLAGLVDSPWPGMTLSLVGAFLVAWSYWDSE